MKIKIPISVLCFLFFIPAAFSSNDDFGIWTYIEVEKKINKKFSVNGELELRTKDNSEEIARWGLKLGGDYTVIKGLKVGAAYQYLHFHDTKYWNFQPRHRFIMYAQGRYKWNRFVFSLRERVQVTTKDENERIKSNGKKDRYKINPAWVWRNRVKVAYDIPKCKVTPSFSFESFYQLNNPDGNQFDGLRYTLSLNYKLNKKNSFELFGVHDRDVNVKNEEYRYVLGAGYTFSF